MLDEIHESKLKGCIWILGKEINGFFTVLIIYHSNQNELK